MNRKTHLTDMTIKIYADGYRIRCQCLKFTVEDQGKEVITGLQKMLLHSRDCERIHGRKD